MGNPLAGHTNSYHTYGHDEALAGDRRAGYRTSSCRPSRAGRSTSTSTRRRPRPAGKLEGYGLEAVSLSGHSDLTTRRGPRARDQGRPVGGRLRAPDRQHRSRRSSVRRRERGAFLGNIGALADAADAAGVVVALEIHGDIMASSEVTIPLLEKIGRDSIRVNYDTANVEYYSGDKAVDDLPKITPYLAHVHLKDTTGGKGNWNFPACGDGVVDFARVLEILRDAGYDGPYSVEIEFQGEPWPPLADVNDAMRRSYEHLSALGLS